MKLNEKEEFSDYPKKKKNLATKAKKKKKQHQHNVALFLKKFQLYSNLFEMWDW